MALTYVLWYGERRGGVDRPRVRFFKFVIRVRSLEERIKDLEKLIFTNRDRETKKIRNRKAEGEIRTRVVASTAACFEYKPQNMLISIKGSERAGDITSPTVSRNAGYCEVQNHSNLATLMLYYTKKELTSYTELRLAGISKASIPWMRRCSKTFWDNTKGVISKERCDSLLTHLSARYTDIWAPRKVMNFATAFLTYLAKTHFDTRYQAFDLFLEMPKGLKVRKHVTGRIVTKEDVENVLYTIQKSYENGEIDSDHYLNYRALVLFAAFGGQRPQATIARLTVGQFRVAVNHQKPVIDVLPGQDKIRMQHYCPLHPQVVDGVRPLLDDRRNDESMFKQLPFERWLKQHKIQLLHCDAHFVPGDLRKFCEQQGDILQWDQSNKNYILTHVLVGWTGGFTSIRCLRTCMTHIWDTGKT